MSTAPVDPPKENEKKKAVDPRDIFSGT